MRRLIRIILLVDSAREYERGLLRGIAKYAQLHGPWSFYKKPAYYLDVSKESINIQEMRAFEPDAIFTCEFPSLDKIMSLRRPTIVSPFTYEVNAGHPLVLPASEQIGRMGAEYLMSRGYRYFGYCGFAGLPWSTTRGRSFAAALEQGGYPCEVYRGTEPDPSGSIKNRAHLARWLNGLPKPLAVLACNDDCSQQVAEACKLADLHVPEQVAILGANNDPMICDLAYPPLSSIALDTETAGYRTAEILAQMVAGQIPTDEVIPVEPTHIVPRRSTDLLAINDPAVAQAVRFVREHAGQLIQVSDVVDSSTLSRSRLTRRFLSSLNRSISDEIARTRMEFIEKLLLETDMPIGRIARRIGYNSADHLARYFHRYRDLTPSAFRKHHSHIAR